MKKPNEAKFQIGDVIRNRYTQQQGRVMRVYSDLRISKREHPGLSYVVLHLPGGDREAIWEDSAVDHSEPGYAAAE